MLEPSSKLEDSSWSQRRSLSVHSVCHLVTNTLVRDATGSGSVWEQLAQPAWLLSSAVPNKSPARPAQICVLLPQRFKLVPSYFSGQVCCCHRVCKNPATLSTLLLHTRLAFFLETKMAIKWLLKGKFKLKCLWKDGSHRKCQLSARQGAAKSSSIHRAG